MTRKPTCSRSKIRAEPRPIADRTRPNPSGLGSPPAQPIDPSVDWPRSVWDGLSSGRPPSKEILGTARTVAAVRRHGRGRGRPAGEIGQVLRKFGRSSWRIVPWFGIAEKISKQGGQRTGGSAGTPITQRAGRQARDGYGCASPSPPHASCCIWRRCCPGWQPCCFSIVCCRWRSSAGCCGFPMRSRVFPFASFAPA